VVDESELKSDAQSEAAEDSASIEEAVSSEEVAPSDETAPAEADETAAAGDPEDEETFSTTDSIFDDLEDEAAPTANASSEGDGDGDDLDVDVLSRLKAIENRVAANAELAQLQVEKAMAAVATAEKAANNLVNYLKTLTNATAPRPTLTPEPPPGPPLIKALGFEMHASESKVFDRTQVLLHVGDGAGAEFHVDLWLPHIVAAGVDVSVVVRSPNVYKNLRDRTDLDLFYIKDSRTAEMLVERCKSLRAVLYLSNTGNTVHFLRFNHLRHIFVGHGDSEKAASCHKFFRAYDEIWTAGQAHIDRFSNSGLNFKGLEFVVVGRPGLQVSVPDAEPTQRFLYMPTWEGFQHEQNYSSVEFGPEIAQVAYFMTNKLPVIKFHPWTGIQAKAFANAEKLYAQNFAASDQESEILPRTTRATDIMPNSDFLIADVSSVVTDYLPQQKPILLYRPRSANIRMSKSNMDLSDYCYVFSDLEELTKILQRSFVDGDDYLREARRQALNYFVDTEKTEANAFAVEMRRAISTPQSLAGV
jgi:hypothetical protein